MELQKYASVRKCLLWTKKPKIYWAWTSMIQIQKHQYARLRLHLLSHPLSLSFYNFPVTQIHFEAKRCRKCSKSTLTRSTNI